ncbi:DUF5919 domain-containing protein [Dactylosporangium sp. NPDC050688]|uniref:DUF5919 domain-containing protein n=1 Tax=Dactylosporangium sp. NPDC050688 TaxID=3157217 RepID=UPI0033EBE153
MFDLRSHSSFRPDVGAFARGQIAKARESLQLSHAEFADLLSPLLGWSPPAETIESWENDVTPPGDVLVAANLATYGTIGNAPGNHATDLIGGVIAENFADVTAVYASRTDFTAHVSLPKLFDGAREIRAMGLSLNMLCQQYSDQRLRDLVEQGVSLKCLFLDPAGHATRANETEEGYPPGHLASLTALNIQTMLNRVRKRVSEDRQRLVQVATYDETIRFNLTFIDNEICVAQPYLPGFRGLESPTFVINRRWPTAGLYPVFDQVFNSMWERRTEL